MTVVDVLSQLTPQMAEVLAKQNQLADNAFATNVGFTEMRENYARERLFWNDGGPVMTETVDSTVPGSVTEIPIRTYHPGLVGLLPCILYVHGGGFVVGDLNTHDRIMRSLAEKTGAVVIGVDYSLSPETKFPQAIHECAAVARYVQKHFESFGVNADHISMAGDSGGASLCLATTMYLRDEVPDGPQIKCLLLYYGMFGLRDSVSQRIFGGEWDGLTQADLDYYMECYLADPHDGGSPYIDCLNADLRNLPPSYVAASGLDPLRDDSIALATMLEELKIPHRLRIFDGVLHGFLHYSRMLPEAGEAFADGAEFYRTTLT